ncbi:hypothetical protein PRIPAC_91703, partial [Pristionchus pacificus]
KICRCLKAFDMKEKCWLLENRKEMLDCQVTCGTCDNFSCQNPFPENVVNCTSLMTQCDDPSFSQFMKEKCPYTCGRCDEKNSMLCHDVANVLTCQSVKNYCNSVDFYDLMSQQCASTCNRCPDGYGGTIGGTCRDHARDVGCWVMCAVSGSYKWGYSGVRRAARIVEPSETDGRQAVVAIRQFQCLVKSHLCNAPAYSGLMARACAKTCNKCNACEDATLLCGYWVSKGFCSSMHYSNDIKRAYCRRSCNMCSGVKPGIPGIPGIPGNPAYPYGTNQGTGIPGNQGIPGNPAYPYGANQGNMGQGLGQSMIPTGLGVNQVHYPRDLPYHHPSLPLASLPSQSSAQS